MLPPLLKFSLSGALGGVLGVVLLAGSNLWTYNRLTHEADVGTIAFTALGEQRFQAVFSAPDGLNRRFELSGDEWQLDTRIIKWKVWANLLGRDTQGF